MAIQILPQEQSLGEKLGSALGTGLGSGLQNLALQRIQQMQTSKGLQALGFNPQESLSLANLDPAILNQIVKSHLARPSEEAFAQALGLSPSQSLNEPLDEELPKESASGKINEAAKELTPSQQQQIEKRKAEGKPIPARLNQKQAAEVAKFQQKERALAQKEKQAAFKETKAERKEILDKARNARNQLEDLSRLEDLEKEGKLDTPGYVQFLERSGLDIPALMNPGSEEFNKVTANFIRDAKSIFGARVSNFEIEQFLKTIPSLSQSPEGRKRVIANLKKVARANVAYSDALKEVLKENKGIPPFDLSEQIDDRIDSKLNKISEKFKEDLAKPVPAGQNKFITGLQAVGGSVLGTPGKLLQAAKGVLPLAEFI